MKLDNLVGQENAKSVIRTLINHCKKENEALPHILISASQGNGKTTFAKAIANEVESNFYSVNCASIGKFKGLFNIIDNMTEKDILFLDEIHGLTKKACESLYTILENFCYYEEGYKIDIPKITIIGASTEIGSLPIPLKSRFKFTANLVPYTEDELVEVCNNVFRDKKIQLSKEMSKVIARTCRGIPRNMVSRAEWIYAYLSGNNISESVDKKRVLDIIALQGVNEDGLEENDIKYLKLLRKNNNGISLNTISSKLNINKENIEKLIEPYLCEKNFIEKSAGRGRTLTVEGKQYLKVLENANL